MSTGLVIGKFMPPHKGHELMIEFGSKMCDSLNVLVCGQETDEIPLDLRWRWMREHYDYNGTNIKVHRVIDDIPMGTIDEHGTVQEDWFWDRWVAKIKPDYPKINLVFSSDLYGERLAKELDARWVPVDPDREAVKISSTQIKENIDLNFQYLMDEAKEFHTKKVVVVGPESCGKSTMVGLLAREYGGGFVPEYGRIVSTIKNNQLTPNDFNDILEGHNTLIDCLVKNSNGMLFVDTEAYTTYLFGKIYLNKEFNYMKEVAIKQNFDLYLLLAPTVDWVDDNLRVQPSEEDRWAFFNEMKFFLQSNCKPYAIIDADNHSSRFMQAAKEMNDFFYS